MADKFYGCRGGAQLENQVTIAASTTSEKVELRIDTTVPKAQVISALEAIKNAVVKNYPQNGAG